MRASRPGTPKAATALSLALTPFQPLAVVCVNGAVAEVTCCLLQSPCAPSFLYARQLLIAPDEGFRDFAWCDPNHSQVPLLRCLHQQFSTPSIQPRQQYSRTALYKVVWPASVSKLSSGRSTSCGGRDSDRLCGSHMRYTLLHQQPAALPLSAKRCCNEHLRVVALIACPATQTHKRYIQRSSPIRLLATRCRQRCRSYTPHGTCCRQPA